MRATQDAKWTRHCGAGCLFELASDPNERQDIASSPAVRGDPTRSASPTPTHAQVGGVLAKMQRVLEQAQASAFNPKRGKVDRSLGGRANCR